MLLRTYIVLLLLYHYSHSINIHILFGLSKCLLPLRQAECVSVVYSQLAAIMFWEKGWGWAEGTSKAQRGKADCFIHASCLYLAVRHILGALLSTCRDCESQELAKNKPTARP